MRRGFSPSLFYVQGSIQAIELDLERFLSAANERALRADDKPRHFCGRLAIASQDETRKSWPTRSRQTAVPFLEFFSIRFVSRWPLAVHSSLKRTLILTSERTYTEEIDEKLNRSINRFFRLNGRDPLRTSFQRRFPNKSIIKIQMRSIVNVNFVIEDLHFGALLFDAPPKII